MPHQPMLLGSLTETTPIRSKPLPRLSYETLKRILILLDAKALGRACAACMVWALHAEYAWELHCIQTYPITREVKKMMQKSGKVLTWQSLYRHHHLSGYNSMFFDREKMKLGIQVHVKGSSRPTVLLSLILDLNKERNKFLVNYNLKQSEKNTYCFPEYPTLTMRVWLYDKNDGRMLELCDSMSATEGTDNIFDVEGNYPHYHWNIDAENILPPETFVDVACYYDYSVTQNGVLFTFSSIELVFWKDPTYERSRESTFEESDEILSYLDRNHFNVSF